MSTSPNAIRPLLKRIGLDAKEVEVYLVLLSLKMARASAIAKASRQSRSNTYLILRALKERGLISEIERGKIIHFVAEPPNRLISFLESREQEARELQTITQGALPLLNAIASTKIAQPRVSFFSGVDGMKQVYKEVLTQEFVALYNPQTSYELFEGNIVTKMLGTEPQLFGRDLLVDNKGAKRYICEVLQHEGYEIRLLPQGITFPTDTIVAGNIVAIFAYDLDNTIVRIENRNIAESFRTWFEMLWTVSTKTSAEET